MLQLHPALSGDLQGSDSEIVLINNDDYDVGTFLTSICWMILMCDQNLPPEFPTQSNERLQEKPKKQYEDERLKTGTETDSEPYTFERFVEPIIQTRAETRNRRPSRYTDERSH